MTTPDLPPAHSHAQPVAAEDLCREWYEAHGPSVYGYLRFHLDSTDEAEDLTADVSSARSARPTGSIPRGAPRRTGCSASPGTRFTIIFAASGADARVAGAMHDLRSDAPSPEERLLWEEEVARLLAAVAERAGDREVIGLRYGSGLDTAEIAGCWGCASGRPDPALARAGRLRRVLER